VLLILANARKKILKKYDRALSSGTNFYRLSKTLFAIHISAEFP